MAKKLLAEGRERNLDYLGVDLWVAIAPEPSPNWVLGVLF